MFFLSTCFENTNEHHRLLYSLEKVLQKAKTHCARLAAKKAQRKWRSPRRAAQVAQHKSMRFVIIGFINFILFLKIWGAEMLFETRCRVFRIVLAKKQIQKKIYGKKIFLIISENNNELFNLNDYLVVKKYDIDEKNLKVPHPKIRERKFVLVPLMELKGNIRIPGYSQNIEELIKSLNKNSDKIKRCNYTINEKNLSYSS